MAPQVPLALENNQVPTSNGIQVFTNGHFSGVLSLLFVFLAKKWETDVKPISVPAGTERSLGEDGFAVMEIEFFGIVRIRTREEVED